MSKRFDVIVIGAGHNGLATACLAAMQGKRVALVEKRAEPGGLAASVEFEPGFRSAGIWHDPGNVFVPVMQSLGLADLIENTPPVIYAINDDGLLFPVSGPTDRAAMGIAQQASADGRSYVRYRSFMNRIRPVLSRFLTRRPLNFLEVEREAPVEVLTRAFGLRLLGSQDMVELLRVAPMPVGDFLGEYFESDVVKAALAMDAILGTFTAPRSPGTTMNLLMHESTAGQSIRGGALALTNALVSRARDLGVEVMCNSAVATILVGNGAVEGVELENGTTISAAAVSASCNPGSVLLDQLPVEALTHTTAQRMLNYRNRGTAAHLLFAVEGSAVFGNPTEESVNRVRIAPTLNYTEKAFDPIKYGSFAADPVLDISIPSIEHPELAPAGKSVVSVLAGYAPLSLDGGWTDDARRAFTNNVVATISRFVPEFEQKIVATTLSTPADLEAEYGLTGGQLHHGEPGIDQMLVRPIPECFDHRTPVEGLTLCGSGTHPGGIVSCMAGALAAQQIARPAKRHSKVA